MYPVGEQKGRTHAAKKWTAELIEAPTTAKERERERERVSTMAKKGICHIILCGFSIGNKDPLFHAKQHGKSVSLFAPRVFFVLCIFLFFCSARFFFSLETMQLTQNMPRHVFFVLHSLWEFLRKNRDFLEKCKYS